MFKLCLAICLFTTAVLAHPTSETIDVPAPSVELENSDNKEVLNVESATNAPAVGRSIGTEVPLTENINTNDESLNPSESRWGWGGPRFYGGWGPRYYGGGWGRGWGGGWGGYYRPYYGGYGWGGYWG